MTYTDPMKRKELERLLRLSPEEREALAAELWGSLEHEARLPVSDEEKGLLDRRLARADADPTAGVPWEELEAELWPSG